MATCINAQNVVRVKTTVQTKTEKMEALNTISKIFILLFLFVAAFIDYRKKEIPFFLPVIGFIPALTLSLIQKTPTLIELALGITVGGIALILAKLTNQAIGYGDGMILICTGAALGFIKNLIMLAIALIIAACACALLMFIKRKRKKDEIAFIPFMFCGYVATIALFV